MSPLIKNKVLSTKRSSCFVVVASSTRPKPKEFFPQSNATKKNTMYHGVDKLTMLLQQNRDRRPGWEKKQAPEIVRRCNRTVKEDAENECASATNPERVGHRKRSMGHWDPIHAFQGVSRAIVQSCRNPPFCSTKQECGEGWEEDKCC